MDVQHWPFAWVHDISDSTVSIYGRVRICDNVCGCFRPVQAYSTYSMCCFDRLLGCSTLAAAPNLRRCKPTTTSNIDLRVVIDFLVPCPVCCPLCRLPIILQGNELFEFNATSGDNLHEEGCPLLRGHAGKELWGLACNSSAPEFCTVGEDKQLRIWDIYSKRCDEDINTNPVDRPSREMLASSFCQ